MQLVFSLVLLPLLMEKFAEFTSPESFVSLRDVVKNVASLYYTSIASYEEPSEEISTELAE